MELKFFPAAKNAKQEKEIIFLASLQKRATMQSLSTTNGNSKMALIKTVNTSELYHMACRMDRGNDFGYKGWNAIGEYLEQLSESIGEDYEVDIIAICCDYTMCEDVNDWWEYYGIYSDIDSGEWEEMDEDEKLEAISDYLHENTSVVCVEENCIIWQAF